MVREILQRKRRQVILADRKKEKLAKLEKELGVKATTDFEDAVTALTTFMICVSISAFEEVVKKIGPASAQGTSSHGYLLHQRNPVKIMHENMPGRFSPRHASRFWSRKQRRQTQSLHPHPNKRRGTKVCRRITKGGWNKKKRTSSSCPPRNMTN